MGPDDEGETGGEDGGACSACGPLPRPGGPYGTYGVAAPGENAANEDRRGERGCYAENAEGDPAQQAATVRDVIAVGP